MTTQPPTERPRIRYKKPWDRESQDKKKRAMRLAARTPFIYFFSCREFVKIGWSTDPTQRLAVIQVCNPDPVSMAALMSGGEKEEAALHRAFKPHYYRAEWYRFEGPITELAMLVRDLSPTHAREVAGDWLLQNYGKTTLLVAQNPDQGLRTKQKTA